MIGSTASRAYIAAPVAGSQIRMPFSSGPRGLNEKGIIREWVGKGETMILW